jgi:3-phosphoshikimate 1-carboxyvinyltransferase
MTIAMLEQFGATVNSADSWEISGRLSGQDLIIEPDLSNAAPFMAAPMICGGTVVIKDWPKKTTQPGDRLREIFSKMGAKIEFVADGLSVTGSGKISGIDINLSNEGELTPVIAAVAALADTPSKLSGIGHLRLHETDRLAALNRELTNLGSKVVEGEDYLEIYPAKLHSGIFHTYEDHRLATAGAVIGLAIPDIEVENIETTRKTLPDFVGLWRELLG